MAEAQMLGEDGETAKAAMEERKKKTAEFANRILHDGANPIQDPCQARLAAKLVAAGMSRTDVLLLLSDPRLKFHPEIRGLYAHPPEKWAYEEYRRRIGFKAVVAQGRSSFLQGCELELAGAERQYGVPKEIIVAILGIETFYGANLGQYDPVSALVTTYELYEKKSPDKAQWAVEELVALQEFGKSRNLDPFTLRSSYCAAIGYGQFIPSSLNRLAVDADGDGVADPFSLTDAIFSIGNYLHAAGWQRNGGLEVDGKNWQVLHAYNKSDNYARFVCEAAMEMKKKPETQVVSKKL